MNQDRTTGKAALTGRGGFSGFPDSTRVAPVPAAFVTELLPAMKDLAELKVSLYLFWALAQKRYDPRFVTLSELAANPQLLSGLADRGKEPLDELRRGLALAVERGTFLQVIVDHGGQRDEAYLLNASASRRAVEKMQVGELRLKAVAALPTAVGTLPEKPNIFQLYEQNIGLLTPLVAEELKDAEMHYPNGWVEDAIKEAARSAKTRPKTPVAVSWKFVQSILQRWEREGKDDGEPGRYPKKKEELAKHIRERYGHIVQR